MNWGSGLAILRFSQWTAADNRGHYQRGHRPNP